MCGFDPVRQAEGKLKEIFRGMSVDVIPTVKGDLSTPHSAGERLVETGAFTWTTSDGEKLFIAEMSDRHLLNALKSLLRRGLQNPYICYELARRSYFKNKENHEQQH